MAIVQIIIQGKNDSGGAFNSTRKDVDLLDAAVGKLKSTFAALGVAAAAWKAYDMAKDSAMMAARYVTLGAAMDVVAARAGYSAGETAKYQKTLQDAGIAMLGARENLTKMASAHMNLANAEGLAKVARDAAVIGATNTSDAYGRMIDGIQRGEVEILKTIGINVNFEDSYKRIAKQLGKTTDELTETEKITARTNAVLEKGKDIAGAYEAAMGTAGKQIASMKRYMDNLKVTVGEVFQDALLVAVGKFTGGLKDANTEAEQLQQKGELQKWGRDVVMVMAGAADAVMMLVAVADIAVTGLRQIYQFGMALTHLTRANLTEAKQSIASITAIGDAWQDRMQKRSASKSFTDVAKDMFATRDANKGADAESRKAFEDKLKADGEARRQEEEARAKAEIEEKKYLENVKNSIAGVKEYSSATKELGKERLQAANEEYSERLRDEIDLYKEGARAADDLVKPLRRYNVEANDIFNERLSHEKSALGKLGAMYEEFKKKIAINAQAKEAKAAGVDILKAYKDTAVGIISAEQDRYKTLLGGERQYASAVKALMKEKNQELKELKKTIEEADKALEEKRRTALGDFSGGYSYLDPNLDALDKRQAMIEKIQRDEAEANAIEDPALKKKKLMAVADAYTQITDAVELGGQTVITQEQAWRFAMDERKRVLGDVTSATEAELEALAGAHQSSLEKMEIYKNKLLELDGVLANLTRTITIDLRVNGMETIQQIQEFVGSAEASPFSGTSSDDSSSVDFGTGWGTWSDGSSADEASGSSADELPEYATGTPYVPHTGPAIIHQGERIIPAAQNKTGFGNVSIGSISITLQSSGNAQTDADQLSRKLVPAIRKQIGRSLAA